jgi:hypothetical protein
MVEKNSFPPSRPRLTPWDVVYMGTLNDGHARHWTEIHRSDGTRVVRLGSKQTEEARAIVAAVNASASGTEQCYWFKDGDRCELDWGHDGRHVV